MPMLSEEERKKGQERGKAYTTTTGQEVANVVQQQKQQQQSTKKSVKERTDKALGGKQLQQTDNYLQSGVTDKGEPIYSIEPAARELNADSLWGATGFRDWARKTWSQVFDPAESSPFLSPEQQAIVPQVQENIQAGLQGVLKWDDWVKGITGISSEEAAQGLAPIISESDTGDIAANFASGAKRSISAGFWTGLSLFGGLDYAVRKMSSVSKAAEELADSVSVLPDIKEYGDFRDFFLEAGTLKLLYNVYRIASSGKGIQDKDAVFLRNLNSSRAIYSLYADETKKQEYIRRYEAGENPQLLAMEIENPWVELGGSIFLDPSTYI